MFLAKKHKMLLIFHIIKIFISMYLFNFVNKRFRYLDPLTYLQTPIFLLSIKICFYFLLSIVTYCQWSFSNHSKMLWYVQKLVRLIHRITSEFQSFWMNTLGRDTPSRLQRTSGDESRRCCRLASAASDQKAALERTAQTTADGKLTCVFCACVRGINCLFQQLSIVYMCHSKGETETKIMGASQ